MYSCFRVVDHFYSRPYYLLDEALTWARAEQRCSEGNDGYLAAANSAEQFDFLRGLYDKYRNQSGSAVGSWIDGKFDNATNKWVCDAYVYGANTACLAEMLWASGEPDHEDTDRCIGVWYQQPDGVVNCNCSKKGLAICATFR